MQVIAHRRTIPDRHTENAGQFVDAILHLPPTVLERATRQPILIAQKRPADAAQHAMESAGGTRRHQDQAGVGHGASIAALSLIVSWKSAR
jgi:hypothetical protein